MFHKIRKVILLFFIVFIAWFFRFNNINWDSNYHLHPDERFLTMVSTAMKLPTTVDEYFNQKVSRLNPVNIGYKFFVYGNFPLVINKYLAVYLKLDDYDGLTILGRHLSAFFDLLVVILVFKVTRLLLNFSHPERSASWRRVEGSSSIQIALWSAFVYAILVLPIQQSHFFTVDTFLNFFMFGSFYFVLRKKNIMSAVFFGLAMSCKVTALFILPLNIFLLFKDSFYRRQSLIKTVFIVGLYCLVAYVSLRIAEPYYFQNKSFFDPRFSGDFVGSLQSLRAMTIKDINNWFPPMVQWINKNTIWHSLINNLVFGFGIINTVFLLVGIGWSISNIKYQISKSRWGNFDIFIIVLWVMGFFVYQSFQTTPALRYFIILYPFLAIFAGIGINFILKRSHRNKLILNTLYFILYTSLLILPLMFSSIYFHKNTRVEASEWIYKNLPNNSYILSEYWDDALPMPNANTYGKTFSGAQLRVFDPDTPEKWQIINQELAKGDYYILSSNRGWGSVTTVPKKYPLMSKFYEDLLVSNCHPERSASWRRVEGSYCYKKIKEFTSYPQLKILNFKFQINDDWSDESFTVYDHPKVLIYRRY